MKPTKTVSVPKLFWCWVCSARLHGRHHRIAIVGGHEVVVHVQCAAKEHLEIKPGAHLKLTASQRRWLTEIGDGHDTEDVPEAMRKWLIARQLIEVTEWSYSRTAPRAKRVRVTAAGRMLSVSEAGKRAMGRTS